MNEFIHSIPSSAYLTGCVLLVLAAILKFYFGNPFKWLGHTLYLSGTLGAGKTSYAAYVARHYRKKGKRIYSTFALEGAVPFDISVDPWPQEPNTVLILDEMLALKKQKFYDEGTLADGLAFARQKSQLVIILSQTHLSDLGDLDGTIQVFAVTKGISLGRLGRINIMKFSSEKFRRTHGFKSPGAVVSFVFIPFSVYGDYNSKKIYGYTANKDLTDIPREDMPRLRIEREARAMVRKETSKRLAKEAAEVYKASLPPEGPAAPQPAPARSAGPAGGRREAQGRARPHWHRPGGRR